MRAARTHRQRMHPKRVLCLWPGATFLRNAQGKEEGKEKARRTILRPTRVQIAEETIGDQSAPKDDSKEVPKEKQKERDCTG